MKNSNIITKQSIQLRHKAEEVLKDKPTSDDIYRFDTEMLHLIHELEVHQIELELQNEELKLAKRQAESAAQKYADLYDYAPSGYFTITNTGEIIRLNYMAANLLGKERLSLLNNRLGFFITDKTKLIFNSFIDKIFENKTRETCEIKLVINTTRINILLSGISSENEGECLLTMVDITELKKAEEALRISEEKYRTIFDNDRDSITILRIGLDGKPSNFIEANPASTTLFGYSRKELLSMSIRDLEKISDKKLKTRMEILKSQGSIDLETVIKNKKGKNRDVEIETVIINYLNEPAIMNITRDITERKQLENNIIKANENLGTILEAIPDLLFEAGLDGRIYHYHYHRSDLKAVPPEVFMGKQFQEIFPADVTNVILEAMQEASINGWSTGKEYMLELAQGRRWFELSVSPIGEKNIDKDKHFIILARDISVRKLMEESGCKSEPICLIKNK